MLQNHLESAARAQQHLDAAGIRSVVIGGLAIAVWGEPRVTKDVDLKVLLWREQAGQLLSALPSDYQLWPGSSEDKLRQTGFIFTQDASGVRVDFILADLAFDEEAVKRGRQLEIISGLPITVCSPEDLIIYKMISNRARDHEDARTVIRRQRDKLDNRYLEHWLRLFEQALDDSTLVSIYRQLQKPLH